MTQQETRGQVFALLQVYVVVVETKRNKYVLTCQGVASAMKNNKAW